MKPNGYQVFHVREEGIGRPFGEPYPSLEAAEESVKIAPDRLSDVTYVILPIYTNRVVK